jgi:hypothetical protein
MKMKRVLALLIVVSAGYAVSSYAQDPTFNFSGTFMDGVAVTGSFTGTEVSGGPNGIVDITSPISVFFNTGSGPIPIDGTISAFSFTGSSWLDTGAVASFNNAFNNFQFIASSGEQVFFLPASLMGNPYDKAYDPALGVYEGPAALSSWSLTLDPAVPDGGSTAMLCGMSLLALGWLRRKLA